VPLPILVVPEFAFSYRLSVKPSPSWSYESLWCRLVKFAYWNSLNGNELAHVFNPEIATPAGLLEQSASPLRKKLRYYLKESERSLSLAFPPTTQAHENTLTDVLRGCQSCYAYGFHSPLFQMSVLERCPIHGNPLVTGCPSCKFAQPFAITPGLHRNGYHCPVCRQNVINFNGFPGSSTFLKKLQMLSRWRHWIENPRRVKPDFKSQKFLFNSKQNDDWLNALRLWNSCYVVLPRFSKITSIQDKTRLLNLIVDTEIDEKGLYKNALQVYCQLRRRRKRMFSAPLFRQCEKILNVNQSWYPAPLDKKQAELFAFVLWRLTWERSICLGRNCSNRFNQNEPLNVIQWLASRPLIPDEDRSEILMQFILELNNSYLRCQKLVEWMLKNGGILISIDISRMLIPRLCVKMLT